MTEVLLFHDDARPLTNVQTSEPWHILDGQFCCCTYLTVLMSHHLIVTCVVHWNTICEDTVVQMMRYCRMSCASICRGWNYRVTVHAVVQRWEETVGKDWDCQLFTVTNISVWLILFLIMLWTNDSLNLPLLMTVTVLTVLLLRIRVFWGCDAMSLVERFLAFWSTVVCLSLGSSSPFFLKCWNPKDECTKILHNVGNHTSSEA